MSGTIADPAAQAIYRYAHGMDRKRFDEAAAVFADGAEIDYSAVRGPKARMSRSELQVFLTGLLGRSELSVHTAVAQVLPGAGKPGTTIAYYAVRHFRPGAEGQRHFFVYGWYEFSLAEGLIDNLKIVVQAMEGDPNILG